MSPEAAKLELVLEELREVKRQLAELVRARPAVPGGDCSLTKREAARRLRCDRTTTLERLLATGALHSVPAPSGRGLRIPESEIARAIHEGVVARVAEAPPLPRARHTPPRRPREAAKDVERSLRQVRVPRDDE